MVRFDKAACIIGVYVKRVEMGTDVLEGAEILCESSARLEDLAFGRERLSGCIIGLRHGIQGGGVWGGTHCSEMQ